MIKNKQQQETTDWIHELSGKPWNFKLQTSCHELAILRFSTIVDQ